MTDGNFSQGIGAEVKVWGAETGQELIALKGDLFGCRTVVWNPDGKQIIASASGDMKVWDGSSPAPLEAQGKAARERCWRRRL